jgi:uncharacterized cupredoxin-like copper-binding protein
VLALFDGPADTTAQVTALDLRFEPPDLEVQAGQVLAISLENDGSLNHDFTIEPLKGEAAFRYPGEPTAGADVRSGGLDVPVQSGSRADIRLRLDQPGTYQFWCNVPGHRAAGMRGTILVE